MSEMAGPFNRGDTIINKHSWVNSDVIKIATIKLLIRI